MAGETTTTSLELRGVLAQTDVRGRLRLLFYEQLAAVGADYSWAALAKRVRGGGAAPYAFSERADGAGLRGECWITVSARGKGGAERKARVLALAEELRAREVEVRARPQAYRFAGADGAERAGTRLVFETLTPLVAAAEKARR
jgi:hypothetical protein